MKTQKAVKSLPRLRAWRRALGFTLIELAVTVAIIAVLAGFLLDRIMFYREQAEQVAMQQVIGNLRSALHLQLALLLARNHEQELLQLSQQNPMDWLAEKPSNYVGEVDSAQLEQMKRLEPGFWYYDKRDKRLLYLIAGSAGKNIGNRVYLNVKLLRGAVTRTGQLQPSAEGIVIEVQGS